MQHTLLFLLAWSLGFFAAIPVGPAQIEMAKRAISGHRLAATMVIAGSASSDALYGAIALFGIAPILQSPRVIASFYAVSVLVLWTLAFLTVRASQNPHKLVLQGTSFSSKRWAWVTGFSVACTNPPIVLSWLVGFALAGRFGLLQPLTTSVKTTFIAGGALGFATYQGILGIVLYRLKRFVSTQVLGKVYFWLGVTLVVLSLFFAYGALRVVLPKM